MKTLDELPGYHEPSRTDSWVIKTPLYGLLSQPCTVFSRDPDLAPLTSKAGHNRPLGQPLASDPDGKSTLGSKPAAEGAGGKAGGKAEGKASRSR